MIALFMLSFIRNLQIKIRKTIIFLVASRLQNLLSQCKKQLKNESFVRKEPEVKMHVKRDDMVYVRGPSEKFVDSPYYSESELCGGAVTVSFFEVPPLVSDALLTFLQRSTHFSKTCCRPLITWKFLASELPFHGWKSPEIAWGDIWTVWWMF
jgi:hypothetical protein